MTVQQGGVVRYSKATSVSMPNVPIIDGQILFITDTSELYVDDGSSRKKVVSSQSPVSSSDTHLVLARPSNGVHLLVSEAALYSSPASSNIIIDTMSGENNNRVRGYHLYSQYWVECQASGFTEDYANTVDIDLNGLVSGYRILYYTWFDGTGNEVCFNTIVYPSTYGPALLESMPSYSSSSYASSSSYPESSGYESAPPSSEEPTEKRIPITVPSYANDVIIYGIKNDSYNSSFAEMVKMTNTSTGNYEYLELSPATDISSLVGSTIYVTIPESLSILAICVIFENSSGVKSDADIIPTKDYEVDVTSSSELMLTVAWYKDSTHLYTDTIAVKASSINNITELHLRPPSNATDFKVTDAANGYTIIDTSKNIFNAEAHGFILVPNGLSYVEFTGNSIPTAVAGNLIILNELGTTQSTPVSIAESLYDRGIISKPMSLYTSSDIGSTINIPLNNGSTIPFTIVALNWYKCTDTSIGKTLVLWANEAVSYQRFDNHSVSCEKARGCGDLPNFYQGGRTQWEVCDLRAWLNNDWLNTLDSTLLAKNIAEVKVPNMVDGSLYDGGNTTNDKAFVLSPNELNNKLPFLGWGSQHVAGTCMPYFADTNNAPLIRAKADVYWTRSWVSRQQTPSSTSSPSLTSVSSVMIVQKNRDLKSKFTSNSSNNRITTDYGTQYKWCSGESLGQFTEEKYKCPSKGEYATTTAKDTKAVVPAIVLYDKYS